MTQTVYQGEDYRRYFDINAFYDHYYEKPGEDEGGFVLDKLHEFYTKTAHFAPDSALILEFGGGPSVSHLVSAAPFASSIVLADYMSAALRVVDEWKKAPSLAAAQLDWTPSFRYILRTLEGNQDDDVLERRADLVKVKLSSLVLCDALDDRPLGNDDYDNYFDVVCTSFCLEVACPTYAQFKLAVKKLAKFLKGSGSWLVLSCALGESSYPVGDKRFFTLRLTEDDVKQAVIEAGFRLVEFDSTSVRYPDENRATGACHAVGQLK
ncbi:nicotinamide N-methyltransferase-like [Oscarella lobularis]|uniref:nicotinamide N-methyltransferase-like n=1 Tax=Oscarella lobularis TaxID=121494 RepID=UPI003313A117